MRLMVDDESGEGLSCRDWQLAPADPSPLWNGVTQRTGTLGARCLLFMTDMILPIQQEESSGEGADLPHLLVPQADDDRSPFPYVEPRCQLSSADITSLLLLLARAPLHLVPGA